MTHTAIMGVKVRPLSEKAQRILLCLFLGVAGGIGAIAGGQIGRDAALYYNITHDTVFCCSYVSNKWYESPFIHLAVSDWTEPEWHPNAAGSEMWLVSDGKVDGVVKFWKLLERRPIDKQ